MHGNTTPNLALRYSERYHKPANATACQNQQLARSSSQTVLTRCVATGKAPETIIQPLPVRLLADASVDHHPQLGDRLPVATHPVGGHVAHIRVAARQEVRTRRPREVLDPRDDDRSRGEADSQSE